MITYKENIIRYFLVTYLRRAGGQIDEQVGFCKSLKPRDLQTCNIILDYKEEKIVKCVLDKKVVPTTFEQLNNYYKRAYPSVVQQIQTLQNVKFEKA